MRRLLILIVLAYCQAVLLAPRPSVAADTTALARATTQPTPDFVRFVEDGHGGGQLQVAVAHYANASGAQVDLLSAIHVGDASFFDQLNQRFDQYDAVLYEMITDGLPVANLRANGIPASHQRLMSELGLTSQLRAIDYARPNFTHADLTWPEIIRLEQDRARHGENADDASLVAKLIVTATRMLTKSPQQERLELAVTADLAASMHAPPAERCRLWRRAIGRGMASDTHVRFGGGRVAPRDAILISARNARAISMLDDELSVGSDRVAILFGAGHMPDLERRLINDRGFHRTSIEWLTVWTVAPDPPPALIATKAIAPQMGN